MDDKKKIKSTDVPFPYLKGRKENVRKNIAKNNKELKKFMKKKSARKTKT